MIVLQIVAAALLLAFVVRVGLIIRSDGWAALSAAVSVTPLLGGFEAGSRGWVYFLERVTGGLFFVLLFSGFLPIVFFGAHMGGIALFAHIAAAPVYAAGLTVLFLVRAEIHKLSEADLDSFGQKDSKKSVDARKIAREKLIFWTLLVLSIAVAGSVLLMMSSIAGEEAQETLLTIHQISSLAFAAVALIALLERVNARLDEKRKKARTATETVEQT